MACGRWRNMRSRVLEQVRQVPQWYVTVMAATPRGRSRPVKRRGVAFMSR